MNYVKNKKLTSNAQSLRKTMTKEERHLWYDFIRNLPVTFHRQKVMGMYILDFYCPACQLAIELDGGQHFEADALEYDNARTEYLETEFGITVLRYTNLEINTNFEGVKEDILSHICHS